MSADTTDQLPDDDGPQLPPQPTYGGEPAPGEEPLLAQAPALPLDGGEKPVLGLGGEPIDTPNGVWYASVDDRGALLTDADGRVIRARPPSSRPHTPLTQLVAGTLAT